jgi:hypothetical protein
VIAQQLGGQFLASWFGPTSIEIQRIEGNWLTESCLQRSPEVLCCPGEEFLTAVESIENEDLPAMASTRSSKKSLFIGQYWNFLFSFYPLDLVLPPLPVHNRVEQPIQTQANISLSPKNTRVRDTSRAI